MSTLQQGKQFYINGAWVNPQQGKDFEVIDPSTEKPFAVISLGSEADVNVTVAAAKAAFPAWSATEPKERLVYVEKSSPSTKSALTKWPKPCRAKSAVRWICPSAHKLRLGNTILKILSMLSRTSSLCSRW